MHDIIEGFRKKDFRKNEYRTVFPRKCWENFPSISLTEDFQKKRNKRKFKFSSDKPNAEKIERRLDQENFNVPGSSLLSRLRFFFFCPYL